MLWRLRRTIHVSWLIAICSVAVLVGVFLAQYAEQSFFTSTIWLIAGTCVFVVGLWRHRVYVIPLVVLAGLCIGLWRGSIEQTQLHIFTTIESKTVIITGTVSDDADTDASGQLQLRLSSLALHNRSVSGKLWISTADGNVKRGDRVTVSGKIGPGFGSFAATMYRAKLLKIEVPHPGDVARIVRDWFADAVRTAIPDPQASLGIGYLVGQKRALPADLTEALQIVGLTHVVVASGYNLTILVRLARRLFIKISKYVSILAASGMIVSFVAITGASPSMTRAGLVSGLSLAAWYYGRKFHPLALLSLAAGVTVLINPSYAWGDLGWQLSFSAFGGVMILAPLLQRYFFGDRKPSTIRQILGETISAQLVTAPVLVAAFSQLSNVAIIANILVLPFVPIAMLLTFIAGIGALIVPGLAGVIGMPANWLLGYMVQVTEYLSKLSWATTSIKLSTIGVCISYIVIVGICIYLWRVTKYNLRDSNVVE